MNTPNDLKRELDAKLGTSLNPSWLADCLAFLEGLNKNGLPSQARLRSMVEDQLLYSNLGVSTLGCLPEDVAERHATVLQGHFLLQVQDCINVSEPSDRHFLHTANRTLKLGLFDGKISVSAMELSHIPQISMEMPAGFKIIVTNPQISRGMLLITKDAVRVLGGAVEELVARNTALKDSMQKSTLPKEWEDSLGQIDDLGTDTRLDEDLQEGNQEHASPPRPQTSSTRIALADPNTTSNAPPTTLSLSTRTGPTTGLVRSNSITASPPAPRPSPVSLSLKPRLFSVSQISVPSASTTAHTATTNSSNGQKPVSKLLSPPKLPSTSTSTSLRPEEFDELINDPELDRIIEVALSQTTKGPKRIQTTPPSTSSQQVDLTKDPASVDAIGKAFTEQRPKLASVDAILNAMNSSPVSSESNHDHRWEIPDMEDMCNPPNSTLTDSQDLIEPPQHAEMEEESVEREMDFPHDSDAEPPASWEYLSPQTKKRKLMENDEEEKADYYAALGITPNRMDDDTYANMDDDDEEEDLMIVTEEQFATQIEANRRM